MRFILLIAFLFLGASFSFAQTFHGNDHVLPVVGEYPQSNKKYSELRSGTPFFQDEWVMGKLLSSDGIVYKDIKVKLNLLDERIHYQDASGKELMIKTPLSQIELHQNKKGESYLFISGNLLPTAKKGWHQVLVNDSVTLLKSYDKVLVEHKSYGSPIEYSIETKERYSIVYNKQLFEIKKPADLVEILPAQKTKIEEVIKNTKGQSKEAQYIAIVKFLNTVN